MQKYEHAFGKNDIRGIYKEDITEELFYNIACGYANWICLQNSKKIEALKLSVCMDARLHSPSLKNAIIAGLTDAGVKHIEDLGLAPTPLGYYSEIAHKLDGALIITASHNPKEYNGYKVYWSDGGQICPNIAKEIIKEVNLIDIGGYRRVYGIRNMCDGFLDGMSKGSGEK